MARDTPPTIPAYSESASWITTGASKTLTASWNAGDILVVIGGCEDIVTLGNPTGSGLAFTSRQSNTTVGCGTQLATAAPGAGGSAVTITMTNSNSAKQWGFGCWVVRGSDGIGTSAEQHTATKTKSITATDTHSAVVWGVFDFNADTAGAGTPSPTNTRQTAQSALHYTRLAVDLVDQASGGATSYGQTGGGTTGTFSIVIMEILGTTSGAVASHYLALAGAGT